MLKIKSLLWIVSVLALGLWGLSSCSKDDDPADEVMNTNMNAEGGTMAPGFTLKSLEGSDVSLSDFDGKVVVLFFFGNTCPSCKSAGLTLQSQLVEMYTDKSDIMFLGLDVWNGNEALVQSFKSSTNVSFPLLLNGGGVSKEYNTTYDRLVVIDKGGYIRFLGKQGAGKDMSSAKAIIDEYLTK